MNVERLYPIWFILCASAGAIIGRITGHGAIQGLKGGMLIAVLPLFLLMLAFFLLRLWRPNLPACRCHRCNHKGYEYVGSGDGVQPGDFVRYRCPQCGREYEWSPGQFNELASDGRMGPYMYHTKWGRWKEAKAESV